MARQWRPLARLLVISVLIAANLAAASHANAHIHGAHWARNRPFSVSLVDWAQYSWEMGAAASNSNNLLGFSWIINGSGGDVYAIDGDYGATWAGLATWDAPGGHFAPGSGIARYNTFYYTDPVNSWMIQAVWCHELAHLWGQDHHWNDSCMTPAAGQIANTLSDHDRLDFNALYDWHEQGHP